MPGRVDGHDFYEVGAQRGEGMQSPSGVDVCADVGLHDGFQLAVVFRLPLIQNRCDFFAFECLPAERACRLMVKLWPGVEGLSAVE